MNISLTLSLPQPTPEFVTLTLPSLNLDTSIVAIGVSVEINNRIANSLDPDETDRYESSGSALFTKTSVLACSDEKVIQ